MVAFQYRMTAGIPGDVNRTHPASILPCLIDAALPPTLFGQAVKVDSATNGVTPLTAADDALTDIFGVTVRPYPFQQSAATNYGAASFGPGGPPVSGEIDVLRAGYIMVSIPAGQSPTKGAPVYVWTDAASGLHVVGGFEAVNTGGSVAALNPLKFFFNGPADSQGNVELGITL